MNSLIRLEEVALFILSIYLFALLNFSWWWFPLLLLIPDVSMVGYIMTNKVGAFFYNIVHHRGIAILIFIIGAVSEQSIIQLIGIMLFAHSTIDRIFGFGLKFADNFKHTHLNDK